jgi:hypothetical protein
MAEVAEIADSIGDAARLGRIGEDLLAAEGAARSIAIGNMEAGLSDLSFTLSKNFPIQFGEIIESTIGDAKIIENDISVAGKRIPLEDFNGYTKTLARDGDFMSFYKKILPDEQFTRIANESSFVKILDENKKLFDSEKPAINQIMGKADRIVVSDAEAAVNERLTSSMPDSVENEVGSAIDNNEDFTPEDAENEASKLTDAQKDEIVKAVDGSKYLKEIKERLLTKGGNMGKWVVSNLGKVVVGLTAAGLAIFIYYQVRKHQNELNGCWAVDKNGNKKKVLKYTCNQGDKNNTKQPASVACKCTIAQERCTNNGTGSCAECCATSECQDPNISLACNSANFSQSGADLVGEVPAAIAEAGEGITRNILKIIGMIILIIVAIFVLFFAFKVLTNFMETHSGKRGKRGGNSEKNRGSGKLNQYGKNSDFLASDNGGFGE